jgi:predicted permease
MQNLGGIEQARQAYRERSTVTRLESLLRDMVYAVRRLRNAPGFTAAAIVTLALGIGANTAVFSIFQAVLLRPLPYAHPERLVIALQADEAHRSTGQFFNIYREFETWQRGSKSFEYLAALSWATQGGAILWQNKPIDLLAIPASADFFSVLGAHAQLGRTFSTSDLGNQCTLVLSYPFWKEKLGAPADIVGQTLRLNREPCQVAGVMPQDFAFYPTATSAWMLITPTSRFAQKPWESMTAVFGLLKPGVTRATAETELTALQARVLPEAPANLTMMRELTPVLLDLKFSFTWLTGRNLRTGLSILLAASGLILFAACLNVAVLFLGRSIEREREMAVRVALGAGHARLFMQLLIEALLLACAGAFAGLLLVFVLLRWFRSTSPIELPPGVTVHLDVRILIFTIAVTLLSSLVFGLLPAWRAARVDPQAALKSGGPGHTATRTAQLTAQLLAVAQVAVSVVLLAGAIWLSESIWKLASVDPGYRTHGILTGSVNLPEDRYPDQGTRSAFAARFEQELESLPGIQSVALGSNITPVGEDQFSIEGDSNPNRSLTVSALDTSEGYFRVLGVPLLRGRFFDARDRRDAPPVALVNHALAEKYFPQGDALGHAIKMSRADDPSAPWLTIIGVVGDVKSGNVFQEMGYSIVPIVYRPLSQVPPSSMVLIAATEEDVLPLTGAIQHQLSSIDDNLILTGLQSMQAKHAAGLAQPRFRAVLSAGFALLALALAIIGLYGVLSRMVLGEVRNIGIRMALGADRTRILRGVVKKALALTLAGIVLGVAGALLIKRPLAGLLYDISAGGATELTAIAAVLVAVALLVAWRPARRAADVDPMRALRAE